MRTRARFRSAAGLAGALLTALALAGAAAAQAPITFLEVALDEETRRADEKLRRYLAQETGESFVAERPLEYGAIVDRLASWPAERGAFVARVTPYAFVAAEMLGAKLEVLGTYVSAATGSTTYHSYFVVSRERFPHAPELASVVEYLRGLGRPASFVYHSKFSTSSYFLPAFFFRSNGIFNMPESSAYHTAIHARELGGSSADLVPAVAEGRFDLAAVWDGTRTRFEEVDSLRARYGDRVHLIQLPTPVPNDLLVASASMDAAARERIQAAIQTMTPDAIAEGDFQTWLDMGSAREAREALANLRWLAHERPPAVTVDVRLSDVGGAVPDSILDAARQAVRLSATELVNYDGDFHAHGDYLWTIERVRDGIITLSSRIIGSDLEDQRFRISFRDAEDLTRRIGSLIHSRLHRIRYVWPYRPERPTLIRDVDFSLPAGSAVRVRRIRWLDVQRNHFQEDAEFEARVESSDFFKIELGPSFVAPAEGGFGFDPMSNVSYRVVLVRPAAESPLFRVLTGGLVFLLVGAAGAFGVAARRGAAP
jgi:ABC-type phosphate/phosphonate transport system substrate-binding protein